MGGTRTVKRVHKEEYRKDNVFIFVLILVRTDVSSSVFLKQKKENKRAKAEQAKKKVNEIVISFFKLGLECYDSVCE